MTYKAKLLLNFTALFAVFTALLVMFQYNRERQYKRSVFEERLRCYADMAAGELHRADSAGTAPFAHGAGHFAPEGLRLTVINRQGGVKYESTSHRPAQMDNHLRRPEVQTALRRGEGSDIRYSDTERREYFYFAKNYGGLVVRVALPYDATVQTLLKADNVFLWFVLMLFPVAVVCLIYISDRFGKAVGSLKNFMRSADKGLVDYDSISFPHSELGDLGKAIMEKYKQLEEQNAVIATERERLMRHFHYFEEGIAIFTPTGQRIYSNPRFMQYANVILERPTPDVQAIWHAAPFAAAQEFLQINGGTRSLTEEAPLLRYTVAAGGSTFAVQLLIYSDASYELTLSDVTKAEKNKTLKQQMSNNITHELRTPVSSIRGYLETVLTCPTLPAERKEYFIGKAHAQVLRLTDLIRDVALITKTEEAAALMPREKVSMARVVADAQEGLAALFEEKEIKLFVEMPDKLTINGNYTLLHAIFRNLMENSLRYAGEGAEIHVCCYNETREFAYFSVYDTGCGVPDEHLPRLFERFYRVGEGRTREAGGTGLGLSIVRNAVCFHHGDISVRNRTPHGLEFIFTLHK